MSMVITPITGDRLPVTCRTSRQRGVIPLFLCFAFSLPVLTESVFAQPVKRVTVDPSAQEAIPTADVEIRRERNQQRWNQFDPEKRAALRRVFRNLQNLPPAKRQAIIQRLRKTDPKIAARLLRGSREFHRHDSPWQEERRERHARFLRGLGDLPPEERERIRGLSPTEFHQYMQQRLEDHLAEYRAQLSPQERLQFDELDRKKQFRALRRDAYQRHLERYRSTLGPIEQESFDALPKREQMKALRRHSISRHLQRYRETLSETERTRFDALEERAQRRELHQHARSLRGGQRPGRDHPRGQPPLPSWLKGNLDPLKAIPPRALRHWLEHGAFPENVSIEASTAEWLERLDAKQRAELRDQLRRLRPSPRNGFPNRDRDRFDRRRDGGNPKAKNRGRERTRPFDRRPPEGSRSPRSGS